MAGITLGGDAMGAQAPWMRNALLVAALAGVGQDGAMPRVAGPSLLPAPRPGWPLLLG